MPEHPVTEALTAFGVVAMNILRGGQPQKVIETEWQREGDHFTQRTKVAQDGSWLVHEHWDTLDGLPEAEAARAALRGTPGIAQQLGQMVGSRSTGILRILAEDLLQAPLLRAIAENNYPPSPDAIHRAYRDQTDVLLDEWVRLRFVAPLARVRSALDVIELGPGVVIKPLNDDDSRLCIRLGLVPPEGRIFDNVVQPPSHGFVTEVDEPKVIGKTAFDSADARFSWDDLPDRLLELFRLFRQCNIGVTGTLSYAPRRLLGSGAGHSNRSIIPRRGQTLLIRQSDVPDLQDLWNALNADGVIRREFLQVALRRFSYAGDRDRLDDRLLDLMISAEALFLTNTGDDKYRGELRFRLAVRAAMYLSDHFPEQETYQLMRQCYDARSSIVHGGTISTPDAELVTAFEERLRKALVLYISTAGTAPGKQSVLGDDTNLLRLRTSTIEPD